MNIDHFSESKLAGMEQKAIITGDIIASRKIPPAMRARLYKDLNDFLKALKGKWITSYETYRGDSLQCLVTSVPDALRVALMIRSYLMSYSSKKRALPGSRFKSAARGYGRHAFEIRLGIGIGNVDFIKKKKITASDGAAFQLSGEAMDSLKGEYQKLICKTENDVLNTDLDAVIVLLDAAATKWTQNQAELVLKKLDNKSDEQASRELDISVSAVNQRKRTAQWYAIEKAVGYFEHKMADSL